MENIIIIGAGQHCDVVLYNMKAQGIYEAVCICDTDWEKCGYVKGNLFIDHYELTIESLKYLQCKYLTNKFFIGFGAMKYRKYVCDFFKEQGWKAVNIIHPDAVVSSETQLGEGVLIEAGCLVTPSPVIGDNVVINTGSQVNHDNIIEDHVYIASGVILSGGVKIGSNTLLDDGVVVTLGCHVGTNCIIGAGAVVTKNVPDNVIAYGAPCKVVRSNMY